MRVEKGIKIMDNPDKLNQVIKDLNKEKGAILSPALYLLRNIYPIRGTLKFKLSEMEEGNVRHL